MFVLIMIFVVSMFINEMVVVSVGFGLIFSLGIGGWVLGLGLVVLSV